MLWQIRPLLHHAHGLRSSDTTLGGLSSSLPELIDDIFHKVGTTKLPLADHTRALLLSIARRSGQALTPLHVGKTALTTPASLIFAVDANAAATHEYWATHARGYALFSCHLILRAASLQRQQPLHEYFQQLPLLTSTASLCDEVSTHSSPLSPSSRAIYQGLVDTEAAAIAMAPGVIESLRSYRAALAKDLTMQQQGVAQGPASHQQRLSYYFHSLHCATDAVAHLQVADDVIDHLTSLLFEDAALPCWTAAAASLPLLQNALECISAAAMRGISPSMPVLAAVLPSVQRVIHNSAIQWAIGSEVFGGEASFEHSESLPFSVAFEYEDDGSAGAPSSDSTASEPLDAGDTGPSIPQQLPLRPYLRFLRCIMYLHQRRDRLHNSFTTFLDQIMDLLDMHNSPLADALSAAYQRSSDEDSTPSPSVASASHRSKLEKRVAAMLRTNCEAHGIPLPHVSSLATSDSNTFTTAHSFVLATTTIAFDHRKKL